jgi:5-methyltetrahydropteroyltriglutamate--homocysteine methyltransferase
MARVTDIGKVLEAIDEDRLWRRSSVIAGTDCGFGTFAGWEAIPSGIVRAKIKTLSEGAALASRRLWGQLG